MLPILHKDIIIKKPKKYKNIMNKSMQQATDDLQATKEMAAFCFETLEKKLIESQSHSKAEQFGHIVCPIFITWLMEEELRGCIGTFSPQPLSKILGKYALVSALQDDRFEPISVGQIPKLTACVSLLVNFQSNKDPLDWQIGRHGIILHLNRNGRKYEATYLPQVAVQWQWTHEQTLKSLLHKAGYYGPFNLVKDHIKITTYESSKVKLTYEQYQTLKTSGVNGEQKTEVIDTIEVKKQEIKQNE